VATRISAAYCDIATPEKEYRGLSSLWNHQSRCREFPRFPVVEFADCKKLHTRCGCTFDAREVPGEGLCCVYTEAPRRCVVPCVFDSIKVSTDMMSTDSIHGLGVFVLKVLSNHDHGCYAAVQQVFARKVAFRHYIISSLVD